ncbi:outer membrane protein [Sphingomonas sp. CJ20]
MRLIAASLMLTLFGALSAAAQDGPDKPFAGPSVTVIAGVEGANHYDGWKAGAVYGGQVGYDMQSNDLVVGVEGEVTGASGRHCTTIHHTTGGNDSSCVATGRDFYLGGRIGTVIGDATLLYAKVGYTNPRRSYDYRVGQSGSFTQTGSVTTDGIRVGAGVERRLTNSMTLKAEYRYSNYTGSFDRHQGVIGVGFRF